MAFKRFMIQQKVTVNNRPVYSGMIVECEESDLSKFTQNLEGGYTVWEVNPTLSDNSKADTNVTQLNAYKHVTFGGKNANDRTVTGVIKPYKGSIFIKNSVSVDDFENALVGGKFMPLDETVTVAYANAQTRTTKGLEASSDSSE